MLEKCRGRDGPGALASITLTDIAEALRCCGAGQPSMRIDARWHNCLRWTDEGPGDLEIMNCRREKA